jgi:hypothetical protein
MKIGQMKIKKRIGCDACWKNEESWWDDDSGTYICAGCEDEKIAEMERDQQSTLCNCRSGDPSCANPNCLGYLS